MASPGNPWGVAYRYSLRPPTLWRLVPDAWPIERIDLATGV
jgi:hypothetical protein